MYLIVVCRLNDCTIFGMAGVGAESISAPVSIFGGYGIRLYGPTDKTGTGHFQLYIFLFPVGDQIHGIFLFSTPGNHIGIAPTAA